MTPLALANPDILRAGALISACGWPTPNGQFTQYWDNGRSVLTKSHGFMKTSLFVHSGASGGPCVCAKTGRVVGVLSMDNDKHGDHKACRRRSLRTSDALR